MAKGFTLIELLVVTSIIVLLTALTLPNYRAGDQQLSLQRAAHLLAQDLRRAQEMALSSQEFDAEVPEGYGIYLNKNQPSQYILFADLDGDQQYSGSSEKVEEITLEGTVIISDLSPELLSVLSITFVPPDPTVWINNSSSGVEARITICPEDDPTKTKTICVNNVGLITIGIEDQCDSDSDCNDGNFCTNDWCERPVDSDSMCHRDALTDGIDCGNCQECQSGVCTYLCQGTESSCECISDFCTDCSIYYGEDCGYETCASNKRPSWSCLGGSCLYLCNSDPSCNICYGIPDNTQVSGCDGTCQACQSGSCGIANIGTDPGSDCSATGCYTGNCNSSGACGYYTSGEGNCPACQTCQEATSGNCVDMADNTQDTEGSNFCNQTCEKCSGGECVSQSSSEDLFNQCGTTGCLTGDCLGTAAACGYYTSGQQNCGVCYTCDDSGSCTPRTVEGSEATALGCSAGSEACRGCDNGICTFYTSGHHGCSICQACEATGNCGISPDTTWEDNLYSCDGTKRCSSGSCISCQGWVYDDGCGGCAGQGGKGCWYKGERDQTCAQVCSGHGGCVAANWNDNTSCSVLEHFFQCWNCKGTSSSYAPWAQDSYVGQEANQQCRYRASGVSLTCAGSWTWQRRVCICNY